MKNSHGSPALVNETRQTVFASAAPPAVKQSNVQPEELSAPSLPTPDQIPAQASSLETQSPSLDTPHESLFDRLRRKWGKIAAASKYSCDSEQLYEAYQREKIAAGLPDTRPGDAGPNPAPATANQPPDIGNPQPETPNPAPEPPKSWEPLNPLTHPKEYNYAVTHGHRIEDRPKYIPDRHWEEDFGNPRKIKGSY